jgi:putative membrane protein
MDRRLVTAGLIAVLSLPALAQQPTVSPIPANPAPAETQPMGSVNTPGAAGSNEERMRRTQQGGSPADTTTQRRQGQAASDGRPAEQAQATPQQNQADIQHIQQTLAGGTVTLQAANFALDKAQHPRVKRFAGFERDEQTTMFEILQSMADPAATSSTNLQAAQATAQNAPQNRAQAAATAPVIAPDAADAMERMSKAQPGPEFDRAFVQLQLDRHRDLLQIQERYLASNPANRGQRALAMMARGQIREHVAELEAIQQELGR